MIPEGRAQGQAHDIVFLFDVDNTLLDNDRFSAELDARLVEALGEPGRARYRQLYDTIRDQRGYADYLEPLQQMRQPCEDDAGLLQLSTFLLDYDFARLLYPGARESLATAGRRGATVILSDGDMVFQPHKIRRAGLWDAVQGRVLVTVHKQRTLDAVQDAYPARHYVMVDDKPGLLAEIKAVLGTRVTTVFVRQGHYAQAGIAQDAPAADATIATIAELANVDLGTGSALIQELP
ncbi:MAG: HAD family hydrolase [Luteimonas sp.]